MATFDEGYCSATDGTRLFWRSAVPEGAPRAWVALVHGYGDHSGRYRWVIERLVEQGLGVLAFDYRGHGRADGARGDCGQWSDYLADLEVFWARVLRAAGGLPTFVLAHSHGALIVTHWALRRPAGLSGLVLSSPFYHLAFDPPALKVLAARLLLRVAPGLPLSNELEVEALSRDPAWQAATAKDPLYGHVTTPRWFFGCMAAQAALAGRGRGLTQPVLVLAGSDDRIASMPAAKALFDTFGADDKTWKDYPDFRHEVLCELNRERPLGDIVAWISSHL